jgi:hypothetical protein
MKIITLVVSFALLAFCAPTLSAQGLVVEKWKYDPETKILSLKLVNTSGKLITGYGWSVIHTYADGSTDALPDGHPSGRTEADFLGGWIDSEMRKGTPTEGLFQDSGTIGFRPGEVKYDTQPQLKDVVDVKAIIDFVTYADCTGEGQNESAFRWFMSRRKDELAGLEKVSEIVKQALADPNDTDPVGTAREEFVQLEHTLARNGGRGDLSLPPQVNAQAMLDAISTLDMFKNPVDNYGNRNGTPREALTKYLAQTEKHIALLRPHTEITPTSEK